MKRKYVAGFAVLACPIILLAAPVLNLQKYSDKYILTYDVPRWQTVVVDQSGLAKKDGTSGDTYDRIRIPDFTYRDDVGKPALPVLAFYMAFARPDQTPTFEVIQQVEERIMLRNPLYPAQIPWPKSRPLSQRPFSIDTAYYNSTGEKAPLARIGETATIRGVPVARIEITPFQYNPREKVVTVIRKFTLAINTTTSIRYRGLDSKAFENYLRHLVANFNDAVEPVKKRSGDYDDYLIITAPRFNADLAEFIRFRQNRFDVSLVTTYTTGATAMQIEQYIRGLDPLPSYILLVGETSDIPVKMGFATDYPRTDLYYSCADDNDYYPDIFLGRFSVNTSTQLEHVLYKTIYMETNMASCDKAGVFVGGTDSDNGYIAEETHDYVTDNYFTPDGYTCIKLYTNSTAASQAEYLSTINNGVIWNFYSGHGSVSSWSVGSGDFNSITASDVDDMENTTSFPYSYAFACNTGTLQESTCISEAWVRNNTHGAVTHIGSSVTSYWGADDEMQRGVVEALYDADNPVTSIAGSMNAGKAHVGGGSRQRYHEMYNLIGDPALDAFPIDRDPFIAVISPNGGEAWEQNTVQTIQWRDNIAGDVAISLHKNDTVAQVIAAATASDGSFEWLIPQEVQADTGYFIHITSVDSSQLSDAGDAGFSITEEYIIMQFPYVQNFDGCDTAAPTRLPDKWEQLDGDDIDWLVWCGPTPSRVGSSPNVTGPDGDHGGDSGNYIYVEASELNNPEKKAHFMTPKCNFSTLTAPQLTCWYHMFSDSNHMGDLYCDICVDSTWHTEVLHLTDNHGDEWFPQTIDLSPYKGERVRFRFRGITGQSWASDICMDDFIITAVPAFTSVPDTTGMAGVAYTYTITGSDEDDDGTGLHFTTDGAPVWLDLTNRGDGTALLCGTPGETDTGTNTVTISLTDGLIGQPVKQSFCITVTAPKPPHIESNPSSVTVTEGETATFRIAVSGDALLYQWQKNQGDIAGATDSVYTTPSTQLSDNNALFRCVVSNLSGRVTSDEAYLTVLPNTAIIVDNTIILNQGLLIAPNPVDAHHKEIRFSMPVPDASHADLTVYDPLGNRVWETVFHGRAVWYLRNRAGRRVANGMYLAVLWITGRDGTIWQIKRNFGVK